MAKESSSDKNDVDSQWIHKVNKFSSQYDDDGWSAKSLCGKPKVYPEYGDNYGSWAQDETDDKQFVEVEIEKSMYIVGVEIYETYNAGGVKRISVRNDKDKWVTVWETDHVTYIDQSRIFKPEIYEPDFKSKHLRIDIDCTAAESWVELDAIKVLGTKEPGPNSGEKLGESKEESSPKRKEHKSGGKSSDGKDVLEQWVKKVKKFSSEYDSTHWPADCLRGKPNVYPNYGDIAGAWATGKKDDKQFAEVQYAKPVKVTGIEIYETFNAGGVTKIKALNKDKKWDTLWKTEQVENIKEARIFSPPIKPTSYKTKTIRIEIDCTVAGTWVEIDAIKLIGKKDHDDDDSSSSSSSSSDSDSDDDKKSKKKSKKKGKVQSKGCFII